MALYTSQTKKGSLTSSKGKVDCKPFECAVVVEPSQRAFSIELTDDQTGKTHTINLYGVEIEVLKAALFQSN